MRHRMGVSLVEGLIYTSVRFTSMLDDPSKRRSISHLDRMNTILLSWTKKKSVGSNTEEN